MKIVFTDRSTAVLNNDLDLSVFEEFGEVIYYDNTAPEELLERIREADAVICNKTVISGETMSQCPNLKYIGLLATGYNNIDVKYAAQHDICVCNAGQYSTDAVAQFTFALMLEIFSCTSSYNSFCQEGKWKQSRNFSVFSASQRELKGKTLGILGCGSIGSKVAAIAKVFDMNVIASVRTPRPLEGIETVSFEELLERSDIISVHCPLTEETKGIFNDSAFAKMKDGAVFINTSRGPVVNEPALRRALESGKLAAAAVDVLEYEPMREDCPLFGAPNLIITPHVAWAPVETRVRLIGIVEDNLRAWLNGEPKNVVSK